MNPTDVALGGLLVVAVLLAAVVDVRVRRIPDLITLPAFLVALGLRAVQGLGTFEVGFLSGALGALCGAVVLGALALRGQMGWGDVKLMAVVGMAVGLPATIAALVFISVAGALQAAAAVLWALAKRQRRGEGIPYAVAIAVGSVCTLWWQHSSGR